MPVITIFSGTHCSEKQVVHAIGSRTAYRLIPESEIVAEAGRLSNIPGNRIERVFSDKTSVFNRLTRERERSLAYLRMALARKLSADGWIMTGFAGQLIPRDIHHVLRVCLIADMTSRVAAAAAEHQVAEPEALKMIHREDEIRAAWMHTLFSTKNPWDSSLYDMVFPTDKMSAEEIAQAISKTVANPAVKPAGTSRRAVEDFDIAARVETAMIGAGHTVGVDVQAGAVILTINKHVLRLKSLEEELKAIAGRVPGVTSVATRLGPGYYQADVYRRQDFEAPSKILLVDDEKKYVQTLSKRLMLRELDSAVVYDGESALELAKEDEPDVMILDLRMPGIDGIEVLRRVKKTHPAIEVIVLTSHGSEADKKICMELGAFAFLSKAVDIDELSSTIKSAHEKIRRDRAARKET